MSRVQAAFHGVDLKTNGVGVILKEELIRNDLKVKRVLSRKSEIEGVMFSVSGYNPQLGCELEVREKLVQTSMDMMGKATEVVKKFWAGFGTQDRNAEG